MHSNALMNLLEVSCHLAWTIEGSCTLLSLPTFASQYRHKSAKLALAISPNLDAILGEICQSTFARVVKDVGWPHFLPIQEDVIQLIHKNCAWTCAQACALQSNVTFMS